MLRFSVRPRFNWVAAIRTIGRPGPSVVAVHIFIFRNDVQKIRKLSMGVGLSVVKRKDASGNTGFNVCQVLSSLLLPCRESYHLVGCEHGWLTFQSRKRRLCYVDLQKHIYRSRLDLNVIKS